MSIKFFLDFVPPWTEIPACLLTTTKSLLLSIINPSFSLSIFIDGKNFFFSIIFFLNIKSKKSTLSFNFSLIELLTFLLFNLILPFLRDFSIKPCGTFSNKFLIHLSILISTDEESII